MLELSPDNSEAKRLLKVVEASDVELQQRRRQTMEDVRKLILAGEYDRAQARLQTSVETDGESEDSEKLSAEIGDAKERAEKGRRRIAEMTVQADQLIANSSFDEAISVVEDALVIDPKNWELRSRLDTAKTGLSKQRVAERRQQEILDTAASITRHLDDGDEEQAGRALSVAVKLYGDLEVSTSSPSDSTGSGRLIVWPQQSRSRTARGPSSKIPISRRPLQHSRRPNGSYRKQKAPPICWLRRARASVSRRKPSGAEWPSTRPL